MPGFNECVCLLTEGEAWAGDGFGLKTSVSTATEIAEADTLMIALVSAIVTSGTAPGDAASVTGWGLTWQKIQHVDLNAIFTVRHHVVAYAAKMGASDLSGSLTASNFGIDCYRIYGAVFRVRNATLGATALDSILQSNKSSNTDAGIV